MENILEKRTWGVFFFGGGGGGGGGIRFKRYQNTSVNYGTVHNLFKEIA